MFIPENLWKRFQWRLQEWLFKLSNKHIQGRFFYRNYGGNFRVGKNITINSGLRKNPTSFGNKSSIIIHGDLSIGDNVGISNSVIYCSNRIEIGDNVLIGSNVKIFDTDFHDTDAIRRAQFGDHEVAKGTVLIGHGVFIGAGSIVGKDTQIGEGAVIGAGSVVFGKKIPARTIWAGNPASYVKDV